MGFLDDLFSVLGESVNRWGNKVMNDQDDARRLSPEQIAYQIEHSSVSKAAAYGTVLKEKYQAMDLNEQSRFIDYIIEKNYEKTFNMIKSL